MNTTIPGLHHVTAITGNAGRNFDFYAGLLGLRLVKRTVNFDDPATYHLYYGDAAGSPGSVITFFVWPNGARGRQGAGQVAITSFAIPQTALGYWVARLVQHAVRYEGPTRRFDEQVLAFRDPDGLSLELVARQGLEHGQSWDGAAVPPEYAIQGIHGVTLWEENPGRTAAMLNDHLAFRLVREEDDRVRFAAGDEVADVVQAHGFWRGEVGVGTVHHVAWRTPDDEEEQQWREKLTRLGYDVTPVRDRQYFRSIYFREPGGVLFEIATDLPGFAVDEPAERLGTHLQLPPWLEPHRSRIEQSLPPLQLPAWNVPGT